MWCAKNWRHSSFPLQHVWFSVHMDVITMDGQKITENRTLDKKTYIKLKVLFYVCVVKRTECVTPQISIRITHIYANTEGGCSNQEGIQSVFSSSSSSSTGHVGLGNKCWSSAIVQPCKPCNRKLDWLKLQQYQSKKRDVLTQSFCQKAEYNLWWGET